MEETLHLLPKSAQRRKLHNRCLLRSCVPSKGALLVLIWSALVHSSGYLLLLPMVDLPNIGSSHWILSPYTLIMASLILTQLFYPFAGLFSETCLKRIWFMLVGTGVIILGITIVAIAAFVCSSVGTNHPGMPYYIVAGLVIHNIGLGMFEANAIQFGVDQLQFDSNEELSKFVHWYFWTVYVIQYTITSIKVLALDLNARNLAFQSIIAFTCTLVALIIVICFKCFKKLTIEPLSHINPLKLIFRVVNFAIKHKQPVRRSAFTYGEGPPSRLDLGKERYGGPFTTEQVEDVKSFWRILSLLIALFGVILPYDAMIAICKYLEIAMKETWFESNLLVRATYTQTLSNGIIIIGIPIYMFIIRPCFCHKFRLFNMLRKMGIGLFLSFVTVFLTAITSFILYDHNVNCSLHSSGDTNTAKSSLDTVGESQELIIYTYPLLLLSQIFTAIGYTLVFLTALEFILAQSPRSMQGFLIGLWYAYQSLGLLSELVTSLIQTKDSIVQCYYWSISSIFIGKAGLAVISFTLYLVVSRQFKYRQREENSQVNYQNIIEEYTFKNIVKRQENSSTFSSDDDIIVEEKV